MSHLENCPECQQEVAAVTGDYFLDRLRLAHGQSGTPIPDKSLAGVAGSLYSTLPPSANPASIPGLPSELINHPQYEVVSELGRGGMGVVYLARHRLSGRLEVLKVMNKEVLARSGSKERFLREIQSAAMLDHPNVVKMYTAMELDDLMVLVMEYVNGEDLAKLVKARGRLPVPNACFYAHQVALGLQHAFEKNMVHRDIKPQNVILAKEGKKHLVKVLDFGLAKVARETGEQFELTGQGQMLGTPDYVAPEQTLDATNADIRADIYSLGCTLYYLLAGHAPFKGKSLYEILQAHQSLDAQPLNLERPEVPTEVAAIVGKMMAKDPAQRFQQPKEVAQALGPFFRADAKVPLSKPAQDSPEEEAAAPAQEVKEIKPEKSTVPLVEASKDLKSDQIVPPKATASQWETIAEINVQSSKTANTESLQHPPTKVSQAIRRKMLVGAGVLIGVLLVGLIGLWAAGAFKVKTKDGVIVLENLPEDAEVTVDGETATLITGDGKTFSISIAAGKKQRLQVRKEGFTTFGEEVEVEAGGRLSLIVRLEPQVAPSNATKQPQAAKTPTDEYDELAKGRWVAVLPSQEEFNRLRTEKGYWGAEPKFVNGNLACNNGGMSFPPLRAKDAIIRTRVKKVERTSKAGVNVCLALRAGNANAVSAWCNGDGWFGIGSIRKGRPYKDLRACKLPDWYDGHFFEFAFAAVGNKLTVYVNGRKILEARDDESTADRAGIAISANKCTGLFRDIEVQILDK
jgi:serine/threonine protein kinase